MNKTPLSLAEAVKRIEDYLQTDLNNAPQPFFVAVDDMGDYRELYTRFISQMATVRVTDTFAKRDGTGNPRYDRIEERIEEDASDKILILGLGDAYLLTGEKVKSVFMKLKDGDYDKKVVVLAHGVYPLMQEFYHANQKFNDYRWIHVPAKIEQNENLDDTDKPKRNYTVTRVNPQLPNAETQTYPGKTVKGLYGLLLELENGNVDDYYVITDRSLLTQRGSLDSAYDVLLLSKRHLHIRREELDEEHWQELLRTKDKLKVPSLMSWQAFYTYKEVEEPINEYHKRVLASAQNWQDYALKLFTAILEIPRTDPEFNDLYLQRKKLLKDFKYVKSEVSDALERYLDASQRYQNVDRLYYLTDATERERKLILEFLAKFDAIPPELEFIYPDLAKYFSEASLICEDSAEIDLTKTVTDYFREYRLIKLRGELPDAFRQKVNDLAQPDRHIFNSFPWLYKTTSEYNDGNTPLIWIDALGVEFVPYIIQKAQEHEMTATVKIAQAVHPTTTKRNHDFFTNWKAKTDTVKELDHLLHANPKDPQKEGVAYLLKELEYIDKALAQAREWLGKAQQVIIASDHGASRLFVLNGQEWTDEVSGKAYNSGRFCEAGEEEDKPVTAMQVDDVLKPGKKLWVFADYSRFHGQGGSGIKHGVEVHGGATLEETLVPVIKLVDAKTITLDITEVNATLKEKGTGKFAQITLILTKPMNTPTLRFNGFTIPARPGDDTADKRVEFDVTEALKNIDPRKQHDVTLYDGVVKVKTFKVTVESHLGKQQSAASGELFKF